MVWGRTVRGERWRTFYNVGAGAEWNGECGEGGAHVGSMTGPWHQVHHETSSHDELLKIEGLGHCSVTVQFRTPLFAFARARNKNTTPAPRRVYAAITRAVHWALSDPSAWRLPTLAEVSREAGLD